MKRFAYILLLLTGCVSVKRSNALVAEAKAAGYQEGLSASQEQLKVLQAKYEAIYNMVQKWRDGLRQPGLRMK